MLHCKWMCGGKHSLSVCQAHKDAEHMAALYHQQRICLGIFTIITVVDEGKIILESLSPYTNNRPGAAREERLKWLITVSAPSLMAVISDLVGFLYHADCLYPVFACWYWWLLLWTVKSCPTAVSRSNRGEKLTILENEWQSCDYSENRGC